MKKCDNPCCMCVELSSFHIMNKLRHNSQLYHAMYKFATNINNNNNTPFACAA